MSAKEEITKAAEHAMPARIKRFSEELSGVLEGWQYVDSDVRVDGTLVAELLGRIGERLVLVHHLVGTREEVTKAALKHLTRAGSDARRLGRKYEAGVGVPPLVVVITEGKTKGLVKQLSALCPDPLALFAERRLSSAGRRVRFLEELAPAVGADARTTRSIESPPSDQGEARSEVPGWERVLDRMDRIDPALERTGADDEMRWSWEGETLCCVALDPGGELIGRIGTEGVQHTLGSDRALEVFLDWVLAHHLELTEGRGEEALRDVELMPHPSEPLLTPEELAAFQD